MIEKNLESVPLRDIEGLPIGVAREESGELVKQVSFIPWGWEEEKAIAKVKEDSRENLTMTQEITQVLIRLIKTWGPFNFQNMDMPEREIRLRNSFFGDVWTAYAKLRVEAMGELLVFAMACPNCRDRFAFEADLRDLDVFVIEAGKVEECVRRYHVAPPMRIGGEACSYIDVRPMKWEVAHNLPGDLLGSEDPRFRAMAFQDAVIGADAIETHGAVLFIEERLETLRKIDIERLSTLVDEMAAGPDLATNVKCPKCKFEYRAFGDWRYEHFFGSTSLPESR